MKDEYARRWGEYRRICKWGICSLVALIAIPFAMVAIFGVMIRFGLSGFLDHLSLLPFITGVALMFATGYFAYCHYVWECPRCGKRFGRNHVECQNCALPKWANNDDSEPTQEEDASGARVGPKPRI
jgi:hypothetical protein